MSEEKMPLFKYELEKEVVDYLLQALEGIQIRGEQAALSLIRVKSLLRNPINVDEVNSYVEKDEAKKKKDSAKK